MYLPLSGYFFSLSPAAGRIPGPCRCPAQDVAKATPAQSAAPVPEPIDLKSQVIVLCYHRFEDRPKDSLAIKPVDFEIQMQALKDKGITVISMEDFLAWRRGEEASRKRLPSLASMTDTFQDTRWRGRF